MVGKGIANALNVFRDRGMLGKGIAIGRNKEKTVDEHLRTLGDTDAQDADRVKIRYFDKRGKELKGKEAFRQMCWKFHGKMPSHKRQEKRRVREEIEQKQMHISVGLNPNLIAGKPAANGDVKRALGSLGSVSVNKKPRKI
jgi:U4/U6.U5 tri-snRNP-associated protein 1